MGQPQPIAHSPSITLLLVVSGAISKLIVPDSFPSPSWLSSSMVNFPLNGSVVLVNQN